MRIDLHTHSTASDGTDTPAGLVAAAVDAGLDVVALTDHDSTAGWAEAAGALAQGAPVALVRGMEISCVADGISLHLLAYLHDDTYEPLVAELARARSSREGRARRIVEALGQDVPLTWDDVAAQARPGATLGRPHIADALVARGIVEDRAEAFRHYLHSGSRYHRGHYALDAVAAVELVRAAGGVPVLAHPFAAVRGRTVGDPVVEELADAGLAGLEAHHLDHDAAQTRRAIGLANRLGLLVTGSSDYHGTGKPNRLGELTTDRAVFEAIEAGARGVPVLRG